MIHFTNAEIINDTVNTVVAKINNSKQIVELISALEILEEYQVNLDESELNDLILNFTSENCKHKVHQTVVERSFSGTYEKSLEQAIEEIENFNPGLTLNIIELLMEVTDAYERRSCLFPNGDCINTWSKSHIKLWAPLAKAAYVNEAEKLAVLKRLLNLTFGLSLRDVQLLVVIAIIKSNVGKGRLCQVNTGEGKTLIIAMVAAFKVLEGHTVDIYTSSPVLAIPQSLEFTKFFEVCNISVTNNINPNSDYTCDVIYGTNNSFQRDVLSGEFRKTNIRKKRNFDVAIVDEVDNMLIDGNNWILKLTSDMPAMDHLETVLAAIYIQVKAVASALIEKNGVVYFREEDESFEENGDLKAEVKYRDIPIEESKRDFIIRCTITHIRKLIRDTENETVEEGYPELKIPKHLRHIVTKKQLNSWIISAVQSIFNYAQDEDYVLYNGKVTVVDTNNTGVLRKNTTWSDGLHQFLQMKHGAKVAAENFTSNFISNVALFSRYSNIFGLTGTLGSKETRTFLHETYDVDSVIIPPFKLKQHKKLKPIIVPNREIWLYKIAQNCIQKLNEGRSALIIMNYIKETEALAKVFTEQFNYKNSKIKLYTMDDNSHVVEKAMNPGDVIITTNIAGRGTDIKLHKTIEKNGGLHVCLTFLPMNSRVEEQNIGRTSRNGNRGTSQLILFVPNKDSISIDVIKKNRSERETSQIKMATNTVKRIKVKDKIFRQFCDCLSEIQGRSSIVKETELKSVEEQFAFWIKMHEDEFDKVDTGIFEKFEEFKQSILEDDRKGTLIKNPYFFVELGNSYLKKNEYDNAIYEYTKAINLDEDFAENAYYNRAWAYLSQYGNNIEKNQNYIDKAISDLKTARKLICEKENGLHLMQTASSSDVFSEQIMNKLSLYNIQKNVIEMAIGPDKDAINQQLKELESHIEQTNDSDLKKNLKSVTKKLKEDKKNIGVLGRAIENKRNIKIEPLSDDFISKDDLRKYKQELEEFEMNGWLKGFKITEVKPIDWLSVISLLGIGFGQLIIGAAITVFSLGAGATIGMGLITEGISDIITAVKDGIINRDFDWAMWALMKVISLTVTVVCAGLKAIKDVARTAYSGVKNVVTSGMKAFNKVTSEGFKIAAKKLGFELSKGVAKEIVTQLVNYGIDKSLIPLIEEAIIELIRDPIENALSENSKVISMLKLDVENKDHAYENQIRAIGQKLLQPKENSKLQTLAVHTAGCIAGNTGFGTVYKVMTILEGSVDFSTFAIDFINKLNEAIDKIELKKKEQSATCDRVEENQNEEIVEESTKQSNSNNDDIDLNKVKVQDEQVQQIRRQCTPSDLSCEFAGLVSTNMIQIMKGNIVSPITQMAVNYSVDGLSSKIYKSLETETEKFRAGKRICDDNNRLYENTSADDTTAQISQEQLAEVNALIDQIESGGPVTLFHLGALSKAANVAIEIYDHNGDLMFPVRNNHGGEPIKLQYHGQNDNIGHFTLLGKNEPFVMGSGDNMCAFNCIAQLTNKDPNQLKADTVNILRSNQNVVAARLDDIKMIETAQNSVFNVKGGAHYYGKNYLDAMQYISSSEGKHGFDNTNAGHPEIHISYKGDPKIRLEMVSDAIGKKIIVKDKKGREMYKTGSQYEGDPIVLQFNLNKKDPHESYFSEPGGTQKLYFHEGNDAEFYNYLGTKLKQKPEDIKKTTTKNLDNLKVPENATCVENKPSTNVPPTGFFTKDDEGYVLDHVLKSKIVQTKMNQINRYNAQLRNGKKYTKSNITIPVQDLNIPRDVTAGQWENGKLIRTFTVKSVFILIQHHDKHQNNPNAQVQIQTIYPIY
ncbi:Protein translocase subunit secA [Papilio xuthus]|uniref:Protein translocase subunit secA n=1 Tax=Papilio xuthus TaxID=66420 RepID=A0A194Q6A8_PAPXU|nr:Protein translocase subunit secA [Papilio xuthus]